MVKHIKFSIFVALLVLGLGRSAGADLAAVGPTDPLTGFPVWYQDANVPAIQVAPCDVVDPVSEGGDVVNNAPCPGLELDDPFGEFVDGNIAEFTYYRMESELDGPNGERFLLRVEVQGGVVPPPLVGNAVRIRLRSLVNTGDYTVTTPFGQFVINVAADPDTGEIADIDEAFLAAEGPAPDFAGTFPGPIQFFMNNGQGGNLLGDGTTFLGDGITPGPLDPGGFVPTPPGFLGFQVQGPGINVQAADFLVEAKTIDCSNNQPPLAAADTAGAEASTPIGINVLANDLGADAGGNPLAPDLPLRPDTVTVTVPATGGTAVANADGTVTYTANAGFTGPDSFTYTVQDGCLEPPLAGATASVDVFVEDLGVTRAVLRVKQMQWRIEGQTSDNRADNIMTIHAGGDGTGPVIGTAAVDAATGRWSFAGNSTASPGATGMISCRSSNGVLLPDIPLALR